MIINNWKIKFIFYLLFLMVIFIYKENKIYVIKKIRKEIKLKIYNLYYIYIWIWYYFNKKG